MHRAGCDRHRNANSDAGGSAIPAADDTPVDRAVPAVEKLRMAADRENTMKQQVILERIEALSDRQLMLCDFARMALGKRDRKAAEMLVKDAMSVDAELRGLISRLGPVEFIGRI